MSSANARLVKLLKEFPDIETWDAETARLFQYKLHVGDVPPGYVLVNECDNDLCVNPAHICCVPDDGPKMVN